MRICLRCSSCSQALLIEGGGPGAPAHGCGWLYQTQHRNVHGSALHPLQRAILSCIHFMLSYETVIAHFAQCAITPPAMYEIIAQSARTLACGARLRILSQLAQQEEIAPTVLSHKLHMALPVVSNHLRRLAGAGLIQRRRSSSWCYGVARSPYSERVFSGRIASWLFSLLKSPKQVSDACTHSELCTFSSSGASSRLHAIIFDAATAFTNVRRLQILRHLACEGPSSVEALTAALKMSESAVSRHGGKLFRRGYVKVSETRNRQIYALARKAKTPVHAKLFGFVRVEWRKR